MTGSDDNATNQTMKERTMKDKTDRPSWWGQDVTDKDGDRYFYMPQLDMYWSDADGGGSGLYDEPLPEKYAPFTPVDPCVTWRGDGSGCTWDELMAACKDGRRARIGWKDDHCHHTATGPLRRLVGMDSWRVDVFTMSTECAEITVWTTDPAPAKPEWWGAKLLHNRGGRGSILRWAGDGYRMGAGILFDFLYDSPNELEDPVVLVDADGNWMGDQA